MYQFDESQQFEEKKIILALINLLIGIGSAILALICLSVVPDCVHDVSLQFLTLFVSQVAVLLISLLVTTISVGYMLAANDPLFVDHSLDNFPGYVLLSCLSSILLLQFLSSLQRYFSVIWPKLYSQICNKNVSFLIILSSVLFGAYYFRDLTVQELSTLNYDLENLRWMFSRHYQSNVRLCLSIGCVLLTAICAVAVARVVFDGLTDKNDLSTSSRRWNILKDIFSVALFLITDLLFACLIAYCHKKAMPFPSSKILGIEKPSPNVYDGFIQTFLVVMWPIIAAIINYGSIRQALGIRTQLMMGSQPSLPMHDNNYSVNQVGLSVKFAAVPVLSFGRKTSSNAHRKQSIAKYNRSSFEVVE